MKDDKGKRKKGRVKHVANDVAKTPGFVITEEPGRGSPEEMIGAGEGA